MTTPHLIPSKACCKCGKVKPLADFGVEGRRPDGHRFRCKGCENEYARAYRMRPKVRARNHLRCTSKAYKELRRQRYPQSRIKANHGVSRAEYKEMLALQDGGCAACGTQNPGWRYGCFVIDHDHETGRIRGLLCTRCNIAIGMLGDNLVGVMKAAEYLRRAAVAIGPYGRRS